jgi:cyclase
MLSRRLVVCLDVSGGRVVKGLSFRQLRDIGDPVELARAYECAGADEIVFLDVSATVQERAMMLDTVRRTAERLTIPLTVGGGIRTVDDVSNALRAGADRVSINSAAVRQPELLRQCATRFGSQAVIASIDASRERNGWLVYTHGGRIAARLDAVAWAQQCAELRAGEILLTSIDRDGTREGYDVELTAAVVDRVGVPVVASGGAGTSSHVVQMLQKTGADAALVAGILHDGQTSVGAIKREMRSGGLPVRWIDD